MSEQKTIDTLTVCRICNQAINFGPPIIGENDQARTLRMMATLHRHLEKYHLQHFKEIIREATGIYAGILGLKLIQSYHVGDVALLAAAEITRAPIHAATRKNTLTDTTLQMLVDDFAAATAGPFAKTVAAAAMPLARKLRDILSEQGEYEHPVVEASKRSSAAKG
jgi:hypothetical protein